MKGIRRRIATAARILSGREWAGRQATTFPDDVFLVSYPKSGNTWLRFLVGNLLRPDDPVTFANIEQRIPSIYVNRDSRLRALPRPRILKSHEAFFSKYKKVVYVARDPRDIAISYYHYLVKYREISERYPMDDFVRRFVEDGFDDHYGTWGDHVMSWLAMQHSRDAFLLLRYEDLLQKPGDEMGKLARILGIDARPERVARAVELSSAERMRSLERSESRRWVSTRRSRQDKPFLRSATSGQWKSGLSEQSIRWIESAWGRAMEKLGYELANEAALSERSPGMDGHEAPSGTIPDFSPDSR